ncbi:MAG: hypothetical protein KTR31_35500 [Myxococcales bacterium]|nr:hypothetical protein [Myxococcales bacterium]
MLIVMGWMLGCSGPGEDTTPTKPSPSTPSAECVPIGSVFDANIAPILQDKCGSCHGATPQFGAPYPIVDHGDIVAGIEGDRKVDAMLDELLEGSMPPQTSPALSHTELDTLVGWASCGAVHPDPPDGLLTNREVWVAGATPPANTIPVDVTADKEEIGPSVLDDYRDFSFTNLTTERMFIRRIEPLIDDSRVLHHMTLTRGPIGLPFLYTWAPGTQAIQMEDGGIVLEPDDELILEIHYNNGAGVPDAVDSSGVRLWVGPPEGREYAVMAPSTWLIRVPPNSESTAEMDCTVSRDFEVVASMPHMHEIGSTLEVNIQRPSGETDNLIDLSGWFFESQFWYDTPLQVRAGDVLDLTCGYVNPTDRTVWAGLGTSDEMCFNFMVVTPAEAAVQCASVF